MAVKLTWVFAACVCVVPTDRLWAAAEPNAADFKAVYARAHEHLRQGRYEEAMKTIATVESAVKASLDREPGRVINVLMVKARVYSLPMDVEGLEGCLAQFEAEYADTAVASWVQRVAWDERRLCYRSMEDLPQAVRALERRWALEKQRVSGPNTDDEYSAVSWDFDLHVRTPAQIGDLYRYMGRTELALEKYRSALEYVTVHFERMRAWDDHLRRLFSHPLSPSRYMKGILPTAIRECEAPPDSPLGILGRQVTCEVEQAEWLSSRARGYSQKRVLDAALQHYRRAQQALEAHRTALDSLDTHDKRRYLAMQEQSARNLADTFEPLRREYRQEQPRPEPPPQR